MSNPLSGVWGVASLSGAGGFGSTGGGAGGNFRLVAEKLVEWDVFQRFLEYNPEIKEKYAVFKTYEILKNDA